MAKSNFLSVDTLCQLQRISGVALAPGGRRALCCVTTPSMEHNRSTSQLWLLNTAGGKPRVLTVCGDKDGQGAWSPSGDRIAFVAKREQQGVADKTPQLYVIAADGGEAQRISNFAPGIEAFRWMPDGKRIIFVAWTWRELKGAAAQNKRHADFSERKESGYATSAHQYRYFDQNLPLGRVPQLWLLDLASGRANNLFEGTAYELPREEPGLSHFDVSADGRHMVFANDLAALKVSGQALSLVELEMRKRHFTTIAHDPRWDFNGPRYSPDGGTIAVVATETGRHHMALGQLAFITRGKRWDQAAVPWPLHVQAPLRWSANGQRLHFTAEERGRCHAWVYHLASVTFTRTVTGGWVQGLDVADVDGEDLLVSAADSVMHPVQVHVYRDGTSLRIESFNNALMKKVALGAVREVEIRGALGDIVQMWLVHPPGFHPKKKHAALHVIHGGPYAASGDTFSYRWNPHLLASRGHVVMQLNYHGSSGFGFDFCSSITGRLGALELQDLHAATDWLMAQPWIDHARVYASGGSYGGFLVAWMNGHWPVWRADGTGGAIRAYVCHAGVFDRVATWSADSYTQRHKDLGATYWADAELVRTQNPVAFAAQMNTPTLVMHGAQDFRVPDHNGLAHYNTLKARGVDARLLWFGDENHWVLKPRNSKQWYGEFFAWLKRHSGASQSKRSERHARRDKQGPVGSSPRRCRVVQSTS